MSKKKIRSTLLVSSLLCFGALTLGSLTSCDTDVINKDENKFESITITNKEALTAEWKLGTATSRRMEITTSPSSNVQSEIMDGNITTTSSDTNVATVNGVNINAVGAGTTTITVTAGTLTDSVTITILPRDEVQTITVAEALALSSGTNNVTVRAEVKQIASGGYFIADNTGIIYVYESIPTGIAVGDTVVVRESTTSEYGGLTQLTDPAEVYKEKEDTINVTLDFEELTGEALNTIYDDKKGAIPVKVTLTMLDEFEDGKFFWTAAGMNDTTVVYTGYIDENTIIKQDFQVNDRYTMTGILGGRGDHTDGRYNFTNRVNFYPISFTKEESIAVTGITLTSSLTTLMQKQSAQLGFDVTPDGAAALPTIEITSGADLIEVDNEKYEITAKVGKAGTATLVAKTGSITSEPLTITVTDEVYEPVTIESVYTGIKNGTINAGDKVFVKGIITYAPKNSNTYGYYVGDGNYSILAYYASGNEGVAVGDTVTVNGTLALYNGALQFDRGAWTIQKDTNVSVTTPTEITLEDMDTYDGDDAGKVVNATGTVSEVYVDPEFGNCNVTMTLANGDSVQVRNDSRYSDADSFAELKVGDKITVRGAFGVYDRDAQGLTEDPSKGQIINAQLVSKDEGGDTPVDPSGDVLASATFNSAMPSGWTYIPNNPSYPNPSFYKDGGLKMNYVDMGVTSPSFTASDSVNVSVLINALNPNTKTNEADDIHVFTVTGLDSSGNEISSAIGYIDELAKGETSSVTISGTGICQVKVVMTAYYNDGTACNNASLGGVTISAVK